MNARLKKLGVALTPPILTSAFRRLTQGYGFYGDYSGWEDAVRNSTGYDSDIILSKVKESLLRVKRGEAAFERDSVLFDHVEYSWPLLASLLWIASHNDNRLGIVDFGGSLGSSYFQNRKFLSHLRELRWNVVEQKRFVDCGKELFEDEHLKFFYDLRASMKHKKPAVIMMSSVLSYIERPYELLDEVSTLGFQYALIDQTLCLKRGNDRLTVQKVDPAIYEASYPCWIFNEKNLLQKLSRTYELVESFDAHVGTEIDLGSTSAMFRGFIFQRKI